MNRKTISQILIAVCLALFGCSADRKPGELFGPAEEGTLVVDALLIVDQSLPDVLLRRTVRPDRPYDRAQAAVRGATVTIGQGAASYRYVEDPDSAGRYIPPTGAPFVSPLTEYRLTVTASGRQASAVTVTPARFALREAVLLDEKSLAVIRRLKMFTDSAESVFTAPENQMTYLDGLLETRFAATGALAYQVGIISLDPDSKRLLEADFMNEDDYKEMVKRQSSSPPLEASDGKLRLPWFMVGYAGRHLVRVCAVDQNWFDFARSSPELAEQQGYGSLAGDNFERPFFRVEGGIGLFGSAAVDSLGFVVHARGE